MVLNLGLDSAVNRYYQDTKDLEERRRIATTGLVARTAVVSVAALLLFPFAEPLSELLFKDRDYASVVRLALATLPFATVFGYCQYLFRFNFRSWAYTATSLGNLFCSAALTLWLVVVADMGVTGIFWAQLVVNASFAVITLWATHGYYGISVSNLLLAKLLRFGVPLIASGFTLFVIRMSDRYFLVFFRDIEEVGLYLIASTTAGVVALLTAGFSPIWGPFVYSTFREPEAPARFARVFDLYSTAVLGMVVAVSIFAVEILSVLTTQAYLAAYVVVPPLAFGAGVYAIGDYFPVGIGITGRTKHRAWIGATAAIVNLALNAALIPFWGMTGAAIATLTAFFVMGVLLMWKSQSMYYVPHRFVRQFVLWGVAGSVVAMVYAYQSVDVSLSQFLLKAMLAAALVPAPLVLGIVKWSDIMLVLNSRSVSMLFRRKDIQEKAST